MRPPAIRVGGCARLSSPLSSLSRHTFGRSTNVFFRSKVVMIVSLQLSTSLFPLECETQGNSLDRCELMYRYRYPRQFLVQERAFNGSTGI
jgi:hypothetical protein